ncbi:MAG: oligosaccharide flippase family protein [Chloroflexi bacterium]|nr:oligosaccharide flippase family protein [Chloroflexota bacterium]
MDQNLIDNTSRDKPKVGQHSPLSAGGWATASLVISYGIGALLYLPLARLLSPADFGLYTEATIFYSGITLAVELSLMRALVRAPGKLEELAQATAWLSLIVGLIGAILCGLLGPLVAIGYNDSRLILILLLLAPGVLGAALGSVPLALLSRDLNFRRRLLPETISVVVAAAIAIGAAFGKAGVYSLVIYQVTRVILNSTIAWKVVHWRPLRKPPDWTILRRLLSFGLPLGGGEVALYARFNVDYAIGGLRLGADTLGVYTLAWNTSDRAAILINSFFGNVGYATFARLQQEDPALLRRIYFSVTRLTASIALPIFLGAVLVREELVAGLFGSRWQGMVAPLLPLFLLQALWAIFYPSVSLVLALGHSRIYAIINTSSLLLAIVAVLVGTANGVVGLAWAMFAVAGSTSLVWGWLAIRSLRPNLQELWYTAKMPLLLIAATLPAIEAVHWLGGTSGMTALIRLGADLSAAGIAFGVVAWRCWPSILQDFNQLRHKLPKEQPTEVGL